MFPKKNREKNRDHDVIIHQQKERRIFELKLSERRKEKYSMIDTILYHLNALAYLLVRCKIKTFFSTEIAGSAIPVVLKCETRNNCYY